MEKVSDNTPIAELQNDSFSENRIFHRFPTNCLARYKNSHDSSEGEVILRNASAQGLKVVSKNPLYVNDFISFAIDVPHSSLPLNVRGEIVWSKRDEKHYWNIGVKLQKIRFVEMSRLYDETSEDA